MFNQNKLKMKYFIFRNSTIEPFFLDNETSYSGYENISEIPEESEAFVWFYMLSFKPDAKVLVEEIASYFSKLLLVSKQIPSNKNLFIFTLNDIFDFHIINGDYSLSKAIAEYNLNIILLAEQNKNIKILDFSNFTTQYPRNQLIDWKYYFLSKMQLNPKIAVEFKCWFSGQMQAIQFKRKKCIIVDLDNTLWGGILGEDGINGIQIGGDYPGNAFLEFQKSLLELTKSGVILAVCSKNNETDVIEAWEKNPNILIKKDHLSAYRINWNNKAENVQGIVAELNIGFDSVVFIDDNPTERELVKQFFPTIETPVFPTQPYLLPIFTKELTERNFRIYSLTEEDKSKTLQYRANAERLDFQKGFADFEEYLSSLEMELQLQKANSFTISRIAQMTQKTNQFNLTTRRYTDSEIIGFIENGDLVYCVSVKDRFGDYGITGAIIIKIDKLIKSVVIDSLLFSCRILGKGIEEAFVFSIFNKLKAEGYKMIHASYLPTSKNEQVRSFYEKIGFEIVSDSINVAEAKNYIINLILNEFKIKPYFNIIEI